MILFVTLIRTGRISTPNSAEPNSKSRRFFLPVFGFTAMLLVCVGVDILMTPRWALPWSPTRPKIVLIALLPWIILSLALTLSAPLRVRQTINNLWKGRPSLNRAKQFQIDDVGITSTDEAYVVRYFWTYCRSYSETENLLRIHLEDNQSILIPKRAATDWQLQALRVAIHANIPAGAFLTNQGTFEVIIPQPVLEIEPGRPRPEFAVPRETHPQ